MFQVIFIFSDWILIIASLIENSASILEKYKSLKEFIEILKDVSLKLILKGEASISHCLPICWF